MPEFSKISPQKLSIERLGAAHIHVLEALHQTSFEKPWTAGEFGKMLSHQETGGLIALNAQLAPLGFILVRGAGDEAEILTLCVDPHHRGQKIATRIIDRLIADHKAQEMGRIFLEVGQENQPAIALYRQCGFEPVGERPDYYRKPGEMPENAIIMAYSCR